MHNLALHFITALICIPSLCINMAKFFGVYNIDFTIDSFESNLVFILSILLFIAILKSIVSILKTSPFFQKISYSAKTLACVLLTLLTNFLIIFSLNINSTNLIPLFSFILLLTAALYLVILKAPPIQDNQKE